MGNRTFSRDAFTGTYSRATSGGTRSATSDAEERIRRGEGMDPLVDPKGPPHLGPIRRSLPRFEQEGSLWRLTCGMPMAVETLLDTTGSMGDNVDLAFVALPHDYDMLTTGSLPVLGRYDVQIATGIFNDLQDYGGGPVLCRSQFEMADKIAEQMTHLVPGRDGSGNGKEDPQFGLFGAAYLTAAAINRYGLRHYHFTVSDEPLVETISRTELKKIFGNGVFDHTKENGFDLTKVRTISTAQAVTDLQGHAHAFFLQVRDRSDVQEQWTRLYGADHVVALPRDDGTKYLHAVKAVIIGLTEGVLDLASTATFLAEHKIPKEAARRIIRAVAHIPMGAQKLLPGFDDLPKAGDLFREKTDLRPVDPQEAEAAEAAEEVSGVSWA